MATRQGIKSVLHNFLGTFTSRYSDYGGYWLFGFIVDKMPYEFDLLGPEHPIADRALHAAATTAMWKFRGQMAKAALPMAILRSSLLKVSRLPGEVRGQVNSHQCMGSDVVVEVRAVTDLGQDFRSERKIFVAPHNPLCEHRSTR